MVKYRQIWPDNMFIIGAGFACDLNMPTSVRQGEFFFNLGKKDTDLEQRVKIALDGESQQKQYESYYSHLSNVLLTLGDNLENDLWHFSVEELEAGKSLFPKEKNEETLKKHLVYLRETYDWDALKRIIQTTPDCTDKADFLRDMLNIIDLYMVAGKGFYTKRQKDSMPYLVTASRLKPAMNCFSMLLNLYFFCAYQTLIKNKKKVIDSYYKFCIALSRHMQKEGVEHYNRLDKNKLNRREFYLFSYSIFNFNYASVLLWLLFNAHRKVNNENPPYLGFPARPMKLFNDFAIFMGIRSVDKNDTPDVWYPFNETVAQRINDPEYNTGRIVRLGKFYFPHGCSFWRECQHCGKITGHIGDKWDIYSESLFPDPIIPALAKSKPRSDDEIEERKLKPDAFQCAYCGTMTYACDTVFIPQTAFKKAYPPYIEEIQRDLKVCIENTKHVILLGYSLPPDDVTWRSVLSSRKRQNLYGGKNEQIKCSVVVGNRGPDRWLYADDLEAHIKENGSGVKTIKSAIEIFGKENVRAYTAGIPKVWERNGGSANARSIETMIDWFTEETQ